MFIIFFIELSSVFQRTTQTCQLSLPPDQRGCKRLHPGTVFFSTNSGLGDTPYHQTTRVIDGAHQALLSVTELFETPNAQRGDSHCQGLFPKGLSRPIVPFCAAISRETISVLRPLSVTAVARRHLTSHALARVLSTFVDHR